MEKKKLYLSWQYAQVEFGTFGSWFLNEERKQGRSKKINTFDFLKEIK